MTTSTKESKVAVKTSKRNQLWVIQKKTGNRWSMIVDTVFTHRKEARECSNQLNNLRPKAGRGINRRYRVAKMIVASPGAVSCQANTIPE
jgi:hypothetical protein